MKEKRGNPFGELARTPVEHFKLYLFAAVSHVTRQAVETLGTFEETYEQFPFLLGYSDELAGSEPNDLTPREAARWWRETLRDWETSARAHLPLRALRETCELDHDAMTLLMCAGLLEEDSRFGSLFEAVQATPGQRRPTAGLLHAWWRDPEGFARVRAALRQLRALGLVQFLNTDAPRPEWAINAPAVLWDVMRGETRADLAPWANYRAPEELRRGEELILSEESRRQFALLPALLASGEAEAVVVRGPLHNGRRTFQGALARSLGRGLLEIQAPDQSQTQPGEGHWQLAGPLATMLDAYPVVVLNVGPGETIELAPLVGYGGAFGVVLGRQGGVGGASAARAVTVQLGMPSIDERRAHWREALGGRAGDDLEATSERLRLTGGNIRRAARLAASYAALEGRGRVRLSDVRQAAHALNRQALDTLAAHVRADGDWSHLATSADTLTELRTLESRCRHRERLGEGAGRVLAGRLNAGVRALFSGPSGTGKTLAARLLASALQMDLYRLDLSTVVNKYIGETEKNLNRVFAHAEELDVILLLDEGDALLTQRTEVSSSNDRYANLETNYLLQRLEAFEGILVVTTNASDRIDPAFARRMDVVVDFRLPEAAERWALWQLHLPAAHAVAPDFLDELAARCELTGGQIRNAVLHASTLSLEEGTRLTDAHLDAAVRREYRKSGAVCSLRAPRPPVALGHDRW
jgi:hypothetical protein